ncbi:hypothetical protein PV387_14655 [Streptomyces sp. ME02-6987-2C]|uniref:hypothetical protein n=1 Tax=unclassified Streptomyces TaxID=2593676 RepID=UPI0029A916B0|nr:MULTISPECIES: hypothetical protein [unclassified Streptomyces]MDX3345857.1 hypothetical protein [Streptomyces sp. ME02-6979A]MDX3367260.1 hypothetical protein [Streptomyces sp. ME02-6987-2C]MDX3404893.1 hypothetical protein [Streptomyces sp. ME02-6977A]MDX3421623.1 hypothetical protein [Streptomyces sp. ME02-6985-2c]
MTTQENRATSPGRIAAGNVVTGRERLLAVEQWLLGAADNELTARQQWRKDGIALLRCGRSFNAVRIPLVTVEAAAGSEYRIMIAAYLHEALLGGPAFVDGSRNLVYCLVAPTADDWRVPDIEYLDEASYLGVPVLRAPGGAQSCWLIEPDGPGVVCRPDPVKQLVEFGRFRAAMQTGA